jgi:hypothetical protein
LVIDNKSQYSDVEKKRKEREREQQSTIQKQEKEREREKKHECRQSVFIVLNYDKLTSITRTYRDRKIFSRRLSFLRF